MSGDEPDDVVDTIAADPEPDAPRDMIESARRRYGGAGAALAAGMVALDEVLGRKVKPDSVQVQEASGQPLDLDEHGISMDVDDETRVESPALDRHPPVMGNRRRRKR